MTNYQNISCLKTDRLFNNYILIDFEGMAECFKNTLETGNI